MLTLRRGLVSEFVEVKLDFEYVGRGKVAQDVSAPLGFRVLHV
jgi:hypothetical protein